MIQRDTGSWMERVRNDILRRLINELALHPLSNHEKHRVGGVKNFPGSSFDKRFIPTEQRFADVIHAQTPACRTFPRACAAAKRRFMYQ